MVKQPIFEPDVSIGDLLALARMSVLYWDRGESNPGAALQAETRASPTRIRNTLIRIAKAAGPVEVEGRARRTQIPNARGRNAGAAGVIAKKILDIASDEATDQDALRIKLTHILDELERQYGAGEFKASSEPARF